MKPTILNLMFLLVSLVPVYGKGDGAESVRMTDSDVIHWDSSLVLPQSDDSTVNPGFAGAFSGYIGDNLVVAGGANFPDSTGVKTWYRSLYIYDGNGCWTVLDDGLPSERGYGLTVPVDNGLLLIGGCDAEKCTDEVLMMTLRNGKPEYTAFPSLPRPLANMAGARVGNKVYLAGGIESMSEAQATGNFFVLDLGSQSQGWKELESWPGESRAFSVAVAQSDGFDECFYLFSGRDFRGGDPWNVLADGYEYNPRLNSWRKLEGEFPVMAGTALPFGTNHILFLGGRNADNSDDNKLRLYHTISESMIEVDMPEGVVLPVTTNALKDKDGNILIVSGETAPRVRTPVILRGEVDTTISRMNWLDIAVIVLYFVLLSLIGWYFSKNQKTSDDYFKGGGRIPWFVVGLSIFGTALSAITFMSIPAKAYATDWSYLLYNAGIILCVPLITMVFIPFFRRLNVMTAYEYLELRFSAAVRILCSIAFILFQIGRMAVVMLLPAIALNVCTGFDIILCISLMGFLSLAYTLMGGIEAVAWTDALQVVVLLGAAVAVLATVCVQLPGDMATIIVSAADAGKLSLGSLAFDLREPTVWTVLIATVFTNITTYGTDQTVVQRYLTTATEQEAKKGVYVNAALTIPASVLFFLVGTALWAFYQYHPQELTMSVTDSDAILPWYMSTQLPKGVLGLVIAGLLAAAMSTLSSSMNSAATAFVTDIWNKTPFASKYADTLKVARLATLILGVVGVGFALVMATWQISSLWDEFSKILGIMLGGLGGLFLLGLTTRKANAAGALCGIIASVITQILVARGGYVNLLLYSTTGFISCFVVGYTVSLLTPGFAKSGIENLTIRRRK